MRDTKNTVKVNAECKNCEGAKLGNCPVCLLMKKLYN